MFADGWRLSVLGIEGVKEPDGEHLVQELGEFTAVWPAEGAGSVVGGETAGYRAAAEDEGDDAAAHIFVDPREAFRFDVGLGLLADLAAQAVADALGEFEDAAGGPPSARLRVAARRTQPWWSMTKAATLAEWRGVDPAMSSVPVPMLTP